MIWRPIWLPGLISIHALLAESDPQDLIAKELALAFLSTLSLRRATLMVGKPPANSLYFYPRSPCGERHEWDRLLPVSHYFYPRSPCGERLLYAMGYYRHSNFYPRSPCGERHGALKHVHQTEEISIHALLAESDAPQQENGQAATISIHALLAESDRQMPLTRFCPGTFLSTLSLRRATHYDNYNLHCVEISIHALLAESDNFRRASKRPITYFYPRSPCGERPSLCFLWC